MPTRKSPFSLPKPTGVRVEKFTPTLPDPASLPEPPHSAPPGKAAAPTDALNLEPVDFQGLESRPPPGYAAPPAPLPPPPADLASPLERAVPDSLLKRLEQRFSVQTTFTRTLESARGSLTVECRPRRFDDYLWAIDEVTRELSGPMAASLGEAARSTLAKHASACRCVLKIDGEWIWDIFEMRQDIRAVQPSWSGESAVGLPDFYASLLARKVSDLFRHRLHPDLLFDLVNALQQEEETQPVPPQAT